MKARIKFLYDGSWTQWYDVDKLLGDELAGIKIEACIVDEECTKDEAERLIQEFHDGSFKFK